MISEEKFLKDLNQTLSLNGEANMDTDLLDLEGWDSFSAVQFIAMASEKYGVALEPFSVAEAVLVEDLYALVTNH